MMSMIRKMFLLLAFFGCMSAASAQKSEAVKVPYLTLGNGVKMPQFGLGTFRMPDNATCKDAVLTALRLGYRHIDTAHAYMDEAGVGEAVNEFIKESGVKREDIWITSKLWPSEYANPQAIDNMLKRLNLDYIDLVYPHQPVGDVKAAWRNMETAVKAGKVRCLGLSNFEVNGAESIYRWCVDSTEIKPVILQMECHPYAQRLKEKEQIWKDGLAVECWYPLGGAASNGALFKDPVIVSIAKAHKVSPAQVIIRWHIQEGHSVIPGATDHGYIKENIEAMNFQLSKAEMKQMRGLNKEKRFYEFNIEATKEFAKMKLPDETAGSNDEWQQKMNDELQQRNNMGDEQTFTALSQNIWKLMADKNTDALKEIFHPNCMFVHMGGFWGTQQELQIIASGMIHYKHAEVSDVQVKQINNDNWAVYSTIVLDAVVGGNTTSHPFFTTQVFTCENGKWLLASFVFTTRLTGPDANR